MKDLEGRVAVVTGAAGGIGYALAERFAAEGMKVVMADVHMESLGAAADRLRATGATVLAHRTDVTDFDSVDRLAERVFEEFGAAHLICNNAGVAVASRERTWEQSLDVWRWVLDVNLWGIIHGIRAFVPRMLESGHEGHIVNTASMAGMVTGQAEAAPYSASKHAVVSVTESLYGELKRAGSLVSASVLCPGWINTDIVANSEREKPRTSGEEALATTSMAAIPGVYPPSVVADRVIEAVREDRFYILATQDAFLEWMKMRHDRIEDGRNPAVPRNPQ